MKPKIIYFGARGRVEAVRLILEDQGVEYEDQRVDVAEWPQLKPTLPFGQLPVYEDEGIEINQSQAIYRYLGRKYDLYGKDELEQLRCDIVQEALVDVQASLGQLFWDPEFSAKREVYEKETLVPFMEKLQLLLNQNKRNDGDSAESYWVGNDVTYVDYIAWTYLDCIRAFAPKTLAQYPDLVKFKKQMELRPRIVEYLQSDRRPETYTAPMASFGGTPETS